MNVDHRYTPFDPTPLPGTPGGFGESKSDTADGNPLSIRSGGGLELGIREYDPAEVDFGPNPVKLGSGAYGVVYKASFHGSPVAVKVLQAEGDAAQAMLGEIALHHRIGPHSNVLPLIGWFWRDRLPCVMTDFMEAGSLLNVLCIHSKNPGRSPCVAPNAYAGGSQVSGDGNYHTPECIHARPSELQLVIYASQAAAGIFHIHKAGILHRDIACRNMLVDSGRVRVSDFGLSRSLAVVQGAVRDVMFSKTEFGPVAWMAPESMSPSSPHKQYSTKSDVFMFGVLLFELFTFGAQPWAGCDAPVIVMQVTSGNSILSQLPADINPSVYSLIEMCVQSEPEHRPSMQDVLARLNLLHDELLRDPSAGRFGSLLPFSPSPAQATPRTGVTWKATRAAVVRVGKPVVLVAGIGLLSFAGLALVRMLSQYSSARGAVDTLELLRVGVFDEYAVPVWKPKVQTVRVAVPTTEPMILQYLRFWNKVLPPPF